MSDRRDGLSADEVRRLWPHKRVRAGVYCQNGVKIGDVWASFMNSWTEGRQEEMGYPYIQTCLEDQVVGRVQIKIEDISEDYYE